MSVILRGLVISFLSFFILTLPSQVRAENSPLDRGPLSKVSFIHYRQGYVSPQLPAHVLNFAKPTGAKGGSACYGFIASGAKWKSTEGYVVNPRNSEGISESDVLPVFAAADTAWDDQVEFNIFGSAATDRDLFFDFEVFDGVNAVKFAPYSDSNAIAVTNVWGYFYGRPASRELVEWDMILNDRYEWGDATVDNTQMDLANIAIHELGHSAGMGDIYDSTCADVTMYGYASEGETNKRSLETPDIAGIRKLYQ